MIDVRLKTIGGPEIGAKLAQAESGIRDALRTRLIGILDAIRDRAQSNAPKDTGLMASRIISFLGTRAPRKSKGRSLGTQIRDVKWKDGRIRGSVMPTGTVAHLVERGVNARFAQRPGHRGRDKFRRGRTELDGKDVHGANYRYWRTLSIAPRPFFMPAVASVGGAEGVNAELQAALDAFIDSGAK